MTPEIGHRHPQTLGWSRFFFMTFFASVYFAAIINITAVPGQSGSNDATVGVNVGVILDFNRADVAGQAGLSFVEMAISNLYGSHPNYTTHLLINTRDSRRDEVVQAAASDVQVQATLGPETSLQADFLIPVGEKAQDPIISSASGPTLASIRSPYLFRATENNSTQVNIVKSFGWQHGTPIYVDNAMGEGFLSSLVDSLRDKTANGGGATNFSFRNNNKIATNIISTADIESIGESSNILVPELPKTSCAGLSDGKLGASAYEVANGDGARAFEFWKNEKGQAKEPMNSSTLVTSSESLGTVIWPGERALMAPRGLEIPTNGKKLRIGVPVRDGFSKFVSVTTNSATNRTSVTGYSIDIFEAVVQALPYALPFEYVPFAGTYNDLVDQILSGKFDAVVGDTAIIANRSNYVDVTLPFTESGVSMVVPVKPNGSKNGWLFLKPWTWDLWLTVFLLFLFIGFVVWVLEHRINQEFRGPPSHQAGTTLWLCFSTMVFAHRENVVSNLTKTVVMIWCFVVLIITLSYTVSFTSFLTMQGLQPTVTDMNELLRKGDFVGYQDGSFVLDLRKQLGFRDDRLVPYGNSDDCELLFRQGKIAAAFDEVPNIKLFLAEHCSKYTMINPTYKTGGFGFVFPKGSPLVPDIPRAVLNVAEGDKMTKIEAARVGMIRRRLDKSSTAISAENQLGLHSYWGLFLIVGVSSVSSLCILAVCKHRKHLLLQNNDSQSNPSLGRRILNILRTTFDKKDLKCHIFKDESVKEDDSLSNPSLWRRILNPFRTFSKKDLKCHTFRDDRFGNEVHLANMNVMRPSMYSVRAEFHVGSPQPPTPLIESLWTQPNDLLR